MLLFLYGTVNYLLSRLENNRKLSNSFVRVFWIFRRSDITIQSHLISSNRPGKNPYFAYFTLALVFANWPYNCCGMPSTFISIRNYWIAFSRVAVTHYMPVHCVHSHAHSFTHTHTHTHTHTFTQTHTNIHIHTPTPTHSHTHTHTHT